MGQNKQITPKQFETLCQVERFQRSRCYSATIGELAEALNISRATAYEHVASLREKGLMVRSTGKARSLRITSRAEKLLEHSRQIQAGSSEFNDFAEPNPSDISNGIYLRGRVCAGYGIDAIEEHTPISLPGLFGDASEIFVLEVSGQSMIEAGIDNGDYVVCRQSQTAENGQIVIALLDDEQATLKRFFKGPNAARLMPENDAFEPIYSTTCKIQAIVVGIVKRF